jgi:DNA-directed RNA polymerase subunit RPC12/RpoP
MADERETPLDWALTSTLWADTRTWVSPFPCPACGYRYLYRVRRPRWMRLAARLGMRRYQYTCSSCHARLASRVAPVPRTGSFSEIHGGAHEEPGA